MTFNLVEMKNRHSEFDDPYLRRIRAKEVFTEVMKTLATVALVASAVFLHVAVPREDYSFTVCLFMFIWDLCSVLAVLERVMRLFFSRPD